MSGISYNHWLNASFASSYHLTGIHSHSHHETMDFPQHFSYPWRLGSSIITKSPHNKLPLIKSKTNGYGKMDRLFENSHETHHETHHETSWNPSWNLQKIPCRSSWKRSEINRAAAAFHLSVAALKLRHHGREGERRRSSSWSWRCLGKARDLPIKKMVIRSQKMRVEQFSHQISWFSHPNEDLAIESGASTIKNEDLAIKQYAHVQTCPNLAHVALFERKWARQKIAKKSRYHPTEDSTCFTLFMVLLPAHDRTAPGTPNM